MAETENMKRHLKGLMSRSYIKYNQTLFMCTEASSLTH